MIFTKIPFSYYFTKLYTKKLCFKEFDGKSRNILKVWKLRNKGIF